MSNPSKFLHTYQTRGFLLQCDSVHCKPNCLSSTHPSMLTRTWCIPYAAIAWHAWVPALACHIRQMNTFFERRMSFLSRVACGSNIRQMKYGNLGESAPSVRFCADWQGRAGSSWTGRSHYSKLRQNQRMYSQHAAPSGGHVHEQTSTLTTSSCST